MMATPLDKQKLYMLLKPQLKAMAAIVTPEMGKKPEDLVVKTANKNDAQKAIVAYLKKGKYKFAEVFKKGKSTSTNVLEVQGFGDIIFKPLRAKGAGGVEFEDQLAVSLKNYFNGVPLSTLEHKDVIAGLEKILKITPMSKYTVSKEGSKNQKRGATFNGTRVVIANSTGKTLSDITLFDERNKPVYMSLKKSKQFYVISASVGKYFSGAEQKGILKYFGFDGASMIGFGPQYVCQAVKAPRSYTTVARGFEELLGDAIGHNVISVIKFGENDVSVSKVGNVNQVTVSNLSAKSYVYPVSGIRKYANIKFNAVINKRRYVIGFQFRGTTSIDVGPKFLRIHLTKA
jgi:hypothetical protein